MLTQARYFLFLWLLLAWSFTSLLAQTDRPTVILIYMDDMGLGDLSYTGGEVFPTPNIDQLAQNGKIFTQYYTTAPVCSPSRVSVTTGMYHVRWNINTFLSARKFNRACGQSDFLSTEAPTIAKVLQAAGYRTAHFGKWHMGGGRDVDDAPAITAYGFDEYRSTWESPDPDPVLTSGNWIWKPEDSVKRWNRTAYFVDHTLRFLREHPNEPCFINLWPDDVHTPWVPYADELGEKSDWFNLENLPPVLSEVDQQIGRLVNELEEMNRLHHTLIIFTSDNGPAPSFQRLRANGLRGVKNSLYEGGINMPFFVHWPAQIKAGQVDSSSLLASIDLLPTLCQLTGAELPQGPELDGEDLSRAFLSEELHPRQRPVFFEYGRNGPYKYPKLGHDRSLQLAIRSGNWKLFSNRDGSQVELYDLASDPVESEDLSLRHPDVVQALKPSLLEWFEQNDRSLVPHKD